MAISDVLPLDDARPASRFQLKSRAPEARNAYTWQISAKWNSARLSY